MRTSSSACNGFSQCKECFKRLDWLLEVMQNEIIQEKLYDACFGQKGGRKYVVKVLQVKIYSRHPDVIHISQ